MRLGILPNVNKSESGCKFGAECLFPHCKVEEQPNKKPEKGGDKSAVAILKKVCDSGVAYHWTQSRQNLQRFLGRATKFWDQFDECDSQGLHCVKQTNIRGNGGPSLSQIQVKILHQRSPFALKFEDLKKRLKDKSDVPAETRGDLPNIFTSSKEKDKATFYSTAEEWFLPAATAIEPEEIEFVVDSGASMHMISRKDLNSAELETVRISKNPTTVVTAKGEVLTKEEATVYIKELDLFVTVMLVEDTPAVLSLGKLCEDHGSSYHWTSG